MLPLLSSLTSETCTQRKIRNPPVSFLRQNNMLSIRSFMLFFLTFIAVRMNLCFTGIPSSLKMLSINGHFEFDKVQFAARDFGNRYQFYPAAILHPSSVSDIAMTIKHIWKMGPRSQLTVAARGHGHSLHGQAQAHQGVVINMESLQGPQMQVHTRNFTYIDVSGGELWINTLIQCRDQWTGISAWPSDQQRSSAGGCNRFVAIYIILLYTRACLWRLLSQLSYIPSTLFISEVTYVEFLDRVQVSAVKLQSKGLWEVPHPWLNLLIPKSKIKKFAEGVFGNILKETSNGPVLIYPVNKSKWDNRTSVVIPEEEIFYLVAFLTSAVPSSKGNDSLEYILTQNMRILEFCKTANLGAKQYLPHYTTRNEWQAHFGPMWETYVQRKTAYDPLAILAPGQRIFQKAKSLS